jgi:cytochrome b subunit of formate dehydrogenase
MYTFGSVSVYALIANVLVLPLVPAGMLLSFLTLCMSFVAPSVTALFGYVTSMLLDGIIALARTVTLLPFATVGVEISFSMMCLLYACMIAGSLWYVHTKKNETWQTTNDGYLTGTISY